MSEVFGKYAGYYDHIYQDKDYSGECDFVETLIEKYGVSKKGAIIDLGCGTGGHSIYLAKNGWSVKGIDKSSKMIEIAKEKANKENLSIDFSVGDISNFNFNEKYDAAISMFAVVSYLTSNNDMIGFLKSVSDSLKVGGILIFDVWFGPAVLTDRPSDRYKIINNDENKIIRFVNSNLNVNEHTVDVNYRILEIDNKKVINEISETHIMRYYFPKEIELFFSVCNLQFVTALPFKETNRIPTEHDWNVTFIAIKK